MRTGPFIAIAVLAPLIGLEVGILMARPALQAPVLRPRLDVSAPLRGVQTANPLLAESVAEPFVLPPGNIQDNARAARCLADAVYYEAALEPVEGRRAVAQVVLNRVRDPNFPKSICGVVYDGWQTPPGCQFSFACDGSLARPPVPSLYRDALDIAGQALAGHVEPQAGLATHYHATSVDPSWRASMVKVAQIGSQIFYRWPGAAGRAPAFTGRYAGGEQVPPASVLIARAANTAPTPVFAAAIVLASAQPRVDDRPLYLYGRRTRSPAEIQQMNLWLEAKRPSAAGMTPAH